MLVTFFWNIVNFEKNWIKTSLLKVSKIDYLKYEIVHYDPEPHALKLSKELLTFKK